MFTTLDMFPRVRRKTSPPPDVYIHPGARPHPKVLVHSFEEEDPHNGITKQVQLMLEEWFQLVSLNQAKTNPELLSMIEGAAVYPQHLDDLKEHLDQMPSLKVVALSSVGVVTNPLDWLLERGVRLAACPCTWQQIKSVADYAVMLMLATSRNLPQEITPDRSNAAAEVKLNDLGHDVTRRTLGIIGLGRIGLEIAKRARAFDMKILYHNRNIRTDTALKTLNIIYCSHLHDLLPVCDYVIISCSLNESSVSLIGQKELHLMKKTAILINIAKGEIVDTGALVYALKHHEIGGAALDVTHPVHLPGDHPLLTLPNVILTPGCATRTHEIKGELWRITVKNLRSALLEDRVMPYEVDLKKLLDKKSTVESTPDKVM